MSTDWTPNFGQLDTAAPQWAAKRPVRILLMGDFSARAGAAKLDTGKTLGERKPLAVDFENFEDVMGRLRPSLQLPIGEHGGALDLAFENLDAFHPDELYAGLPLFSQLSALRKQLASSATFEKAAAQLTSSAGTGLKPVSTANRDLAARGAALPVQAKRSDFAQLVGRRAGAARPLKLDAMIRDIVAPFVSPAVDKKRQEGFIAAVDQGLSDAMRTVLHHPDFQTLESLWRGLDFLIRRLETHAELQIFMCDVSAEEFAADLSAQDDLSQSGLYRMLVEKPSLVKDGGFSLICGLYDFEMTPPQAELLGRAAKLATQAGALFAAGLRPDHVATPDLKLPELAVTAWKTLRGLPESRALALATPRFMLRQPYGAKSDPISAFKFEEFTPQEGLRSLLWGHPAILLATALVGAQGKLVEAVDELAFHTMRDADGETVALPCTERAFNTATAALVVSRGVVAVVGPKGAPSVRLGGLSSLNGEPLAPLGKPRPAGARAKVQTAVGFGVGTARPAPAPPPAEETADSAAEVAAEPALEETPLVDETPVTETGAESTEAPSELDSALASMDQPAAEPAGDPSSTDPDLDALLKSLE